jgi:[acyl-carrier-protein] S-malonyltransferase
MGVDIASVSPAAASVLAQLAEIQPAINALRIDGPLEELIRTRNAQPAIFSVNCACLAALNEAGVQPAVVAGHSLGEYSALVAAGAIEFERGLPLVVERGAMMERCAISTAGTMRAIIGMDVERVGEIVGALGLQATLAIANDNAAGQIVISGAVDSVEHAAGALKQAGGRVMPLPVGGAFHSPLMAAAESAFAETLDATNFAEPTVPLVSNRTAAAARTASEVREGLRGQIVSTVRWRESVERMLGQGVDTFVEVGPGKVLSGIIARATRGQGVRVVNVEDASSLAATLAAIG